MNSGAKKIKSLHHILLKWGGKIGDSLKFPACAQVYEGHATEWKTVAQKTIPDDHQSVPDVLGMDAVDCMCENAELKAWKGPYNWTEK